MRRCEDPTAEWGRAEPQSDEVGVKRTTDSRCCEVYPLSGGAVALLFRPLALVGRLSRPPMYRYSTYRSALLGCANVREDAGIFLWYGRGFVRNAYMVVVVFADSSHLGR